MRTVRIGVIGAGWWAAENHIPVLAGMPGVEVAGVCALGREHLQRLQQRFGIAFATESSEELLDSPGLDGVVISSPHHLHFAHAKGALERGLHVVCEKPMTLVAAHARELRDLAHAKGLHFLIPYGWNYCELAGEAKRQAAGIGEVQHALCHMASPLRDLFDGKPTWFAANAFVQPQAATWADPATGGGWAHGQLTHALGLLFLLADLQPESVFCFAGRGNTGVDLFDSLSCRFTSGATATAGGAATMPPGSAYQVDIRLFGTEGMLLLDIERPRLEIRLNDGSSSVSAVQQQPGAYSCVEPLQRFVDLVRGQPVENLSSARLGARVVEVLDAAMRSAQSGLPERV